ncbi:MAG: phenylalanine--tRNA ligase subunit beta [Candidatus Omnitrophica bacterium]|nr:phenylalanine--tRNA ligase subunit beta [Candidatus Omnitrophota bacterium]
MKINLNWIKDYIDIPNKVDELAHKLTLSGQEVEKIEKINGDTVFELEVTPNRPDCLSFIGLAREFSAILNKNLKKPKIKKIKFLNNKCDITIEDKKDCSRYIGAILTGVKIAQSPLGMQKNLKTIGLRPINNIVDVTNFCLMETGQPMHAFDYDKLKGNKVVVRRAKKGEKIIAIDDVVYDLDPSILVIADEKKPVAIAGIMGGKEAEVTKETKNILLESAYFDPILIRRASRNLALRSDSSYRFERGVDVNVVEAGIKRAVNLIQDLAGGVAFSQKDVYPGKSKKIQKKIDVTTDQINSLLGANLPTTRIKNILKKLECSVSEKKKNCLEVAPPSFRSDITKDVDVIEEIARVVGFDNLPLKMPEIKAQNIVGSQKWIFKKDLSQALTGQGLDEIISYTMVGEKTIENANISFDKEIIQNQNPLTEDQVFMRTDSLPSILNIVSLNIKRGQKNLKLFELGKIYPASGEKDILSIVMTGDRSKDWRSLKKEKIDFYDIKGTVENVLGYFLKEEGCFEKAEICYCQKGQSAEVVFKGKKIGFLGKIDEGVLNRWDIKYQDVFFAQIETSSIFKASQKIEKYKAVCEYPCVVRDISLSLQENISYQKIKDVILRDNEPLLLEVDFVEQYLGEKLEKGHRGVTISLTYQSFQKTLTEQEVQEVHGNICQRIIADLQAIKR